MNQVSVAALKARLSEYLAAARRGEDVIVTDRGRPVARLSGLVDDPRLDARVAELVRLGLMRPPKHKLSAGFWERERPADAEAAALGAILDEREDGR
ncbi:MAG: type II toxin-antitoxin system prevent-host-death family antitoxin [Gemmatimonadetes bacterium]|nr:type II toxin-antitoxin system prevent-host-death family antitoxin [Gemmatimonadota bacterium]